MSHFLSVERVETKMGEMHYKNLIIVVIISISVLWLPLLDTTSVTYTGLNILIQMYNV